MSPLAIVDQAISTDQVRRLAQERFGDMVKAVVDVQKKIMAIGGDLHADAEALLLERGSPQDCLWGINIYPDRPRSEWIEFDSMINIRPSQNNRSRSVENPDIRQQITAAVNQLIP